MNVRFICINCVNVKASLGLSDKDCNVNHHAFSTECKVLQLKIKIESERISCHTCVVLLYISLKWNFEIIKSTTTGVSL